MRLQQSFPESLQRVLQDRRAFVETVRYTVVDPPGRPGPPGTTRLLTLEFVQGTENHARGRFPEARAASVPLALVWLAATLALTTKGLVALAVGGGPAGDEADLVADIARAEDNVRSFGWEPVVATHALARVTSLKHACGRAPDTSPPVATPTISPTR